MTQYSDPNQMGQPGYSEPEPADDRKNTLGLVGFIVSLASIITCGILAPIGVIVSFFGLFKRPRGFAVAGLVIGLVLSLFGFLVGAGMVMGFLGLKETGGVMQQGVALGVGGQQIVSFYEDNGRLPTESEFDQLLTDTVEQEMGWMMDEFDVAYRYEPVSDTAVRLTFPGFDGQFDTQDDLSDVIDATAGSAPGGGSGTP